MKRRQFITLFGGAAVAWPFAAGAQQPDRMRRLGVLVTGLESDAEGLIWRTAFMRQLQELGWMEGRNLIIDYRFGAVGVNRMPDFAKELIALRDPT